MFLSLSRTTHSLWTSELSHYQVRNYVRSYASYLNINSNDENPATSYNTRVEHVEKRINQAGQEQGWRLWLRSLEPTQSNKYRATWWTEVHFTSLACLSLTLNLIDGRYRISMLSSSQWAGTIHHQCRPFPVWGSGYGGFLILSVTRDNIGDQRHIPIRRYSSLVHL